jgi:enoyl-CoA hydratase/carnithine racemase
MNMLNNDFIERISMKLDEVEATKGAAVLVTVASGPKVFSSGFDLKYWGKNPYNVLFSL